MTDGNRLLTGLPADLQAKLQPDLEKVTLDLRDVISTRGEPLKWVYFPTTCMLSVVVEFSTGNTIEAELVGSDGHTGTNLLLGRDSANTNAMVQIAGESWRMKAGKFTEHLTDRRFRDPLGAYSSNSFTIVGQLAGCVAFHPVEQRLARWLLMVRDRVRREEFLLTHEFLGVMLGVYRPTVTVAIHMLERAGLIEHRRGRISIVDTEGLEEAACECYAVIRSLAAE